MDTIFEKNLIPTKKASELSGYTSDYLARLARSGKISAHRVGHAWFVDSESLRHFLDQQGDRKIDYARALARARELEYRAFHSQVHQVKSALTRPLQVPERFANTVNLLRSNALAVVISGAFAANASPFPFLANQIAEIAHDVGYGFGETFGDIPSRVATRIKKADIEMRSFALHKPMDLALQFPTDYNFSSLRISIQNESTTPRETFVLSYVITTADENDTQRFDAYAFVTNPSRIINSLARAYISIGNSTYGTIISSLDFYRSLVEISGTKTLSFASYTRDTIAAAPQQSAKAVVTLMGETGNLLVQNTARLPALATTIYLRTTEAPAIIAPAIAGSVFRAEYEASLHLVRTTQDVSVAYIEAITEMGRFYYESTLALNKFGEIMPSVVKNMYLATLGKSALALDSFAHIPKVAAVISATEPLFTAVAPAFSTVEQIALATYKSIQKIFNSTSRSLTTFFAPSPSIIIPTGVPKPRVLTTDTPTPQSTTNSYPSYTTIVRGVSEDFVNQSLTSLRNSVLATVAGMIQPVSRQVINNSTTIQQVSRIEDLSNLIVRNGDFRGSIFDSGIRVSATSGNFTTLIGGATTLATTTVTGDLAVSGTTTPSIVLATDHIKSPYFVATSTTATSTFAGGLTVGTSKLVVDSTTGNLGVGTTSPYAKLSVVGETVSTYFTATSTTATSTFAGRLAASFSPTLAHTFSSWTSGASGANPLGAAIIINPASATADSNLLSASVNNSVKFLIDAEGDVFSNSLTTTGTVTLSTTTASTFSVENNTTLGDSITDTTTINGTLTVTGATNVATVAGNFGIGTTSPYAKLSVHANSGETNTTLFAIASSTASATTSLFSINNVGNVTLAGTLSASSLSLTSPLAVTSGGTGLASVADGSLLFGSGSTALTALATTSGAGRFLSLDFTTGRPSWTATSSLGVALSDTTGTLAVNRGGTNLTSYTLNQLLYASGTGTIGQIATSSLGLAISDTTGTLAVARGGTGVTTSTGTGNVVLSASPTFTGTANFANLTLTGNASTTLFSSYGPAYFGATATSSFSSAGALTLITPLLVGSGGTGVTATSSLGIALSDTTGTLAVNRGGTNLTSYTLNQLLYASGTGTIGQIATSSLGLAISDTTGTLAVARGGTGVTTSTGTGNVVLSASPTFTGTANFANLTLTGNASTTLLSSYGPSYFGATATSSFSSAGVLTLASDLAVSEGGTGASTLTGILKGSGTSAFAALTTSAGIAGEISDETGSGNLVFSASPTFTGTATFANASTTALSCLGNCGFGSTATSSFSSAGILTLASALAVTSGGTGATTLNDLITLGTHTTGNYVATLANAGGLTIANSGSETAAVTAALNLGNANSWTALQSFSNASSTLFSNFGTAYFGGTATSSFSSAGALTLITPLLVGSGGTGVTATSSLGIALSDTTGTLAVNRGGTNLTSYTLNQLLYASGTGTIGQIATSSLGLLTTNVAEGSNLYYTDARARASISASSPISYNSGTGALSFLFNTANTWTGLNQFGNASTSLFSSYGPSYFGGTATSSFSSAGVLSLASDLAVSEGGTGASTLTGILKGSGTSAFTALTTSAGIAGEITDETGSGNLVFSASPTFTGLASFAQASTTRFSVFDRLYIGDTATTTILGSATSTFGAGIAGTYLNITGTSATSTFANGIQLSAGCFRLADGTCAGTGGGGSGTVNTGTAGQTAYYAANGTALTATSTIFLSTGQLVGIGTTSPGHKLEVAGNINFTGKLLEDGVEPFATMIAPFAGSCPTGWTEYTAARGRTVIGTPSGGTNAGTLGVALTNLASSTITDVAAHLHSVDPPSTATDSQGAHTHTQGDSQKNKGTSEGGNILLSGGNDPATASGTFTTTASAGAHTHSTDIAAFNSASTGVASVDVTMPYIQLTYCQKTAGADIAEWIPASEDISQATIVSVDPDNREKVVVSEREYDNSVVGIVATQPGWLLGQEAKGSVQLALAGRVPVRVTLKNGEIKPGDPITTSSIPGVGMKATKAGPIIGKAMEAVNETSSLTSCTDPASNQPQKCGTALVFLNVSWYSPTTDSNDDYITQQAGGSFYEPLGFSDDLENGDIADLYYQDAPKQGYPGQFEKLGHVGKADGTSGKVVAGIISTTIGGDGELLRRIRENNKIVKEVRLIHYGKAEMKIAPNSPDILPGDPISLSLTKRGMGTKTEGPELVIARALEAWSSDINKSTILVMVGQLWLGGQIKIDTNGNVGIGTTTLNAKLTVSGNVFADSYETALTPATGFPSTSLGTGTSTMVTAEIPSAVLTADGNGVDIYKLATYNLSGLSALASTTAAHEVRITALEKRVDALESGAISVSTTSPLSLSSSTIASALESFGVLIQKGIAQFNTLVFRTLVASKDADGTSSAGSVSILAGNTVARVNNSIVLPSTKVFITFNSQITGSWWVSDKLAGSFRVVLSEPQTADVSFDYFLVQTEGQLATSTPPTISNSQFSISNQFSNSNVPNDTTAPVITLLGDNPVHVSVGLPGQGGIFVDPGITVVDDTDSAPTHTTFVNGIEQPVSSIDTGSQTTYIITYSATDRKGNSATATRSVIVGSPVPDSVSQTSSTEALAPVSSDITVPVVILAGDAAMQITVGDAFTDPGATATDDTDGDITSHIVITGAVDTATTGLYTLTYTATDTAGNSASVSRVVTAIAELSDSAATSTTQQ